MKKYIYIYLGGKYYRLEVDNELDILLKRTLKDDYQYKDNILQLNNEDTTKTYNLKTKVIRTIINQIKTYDLPADLADKVDRIRHSLGNKSTTYASDLKEIENTLNEIMQIYASVRTNLIKKDEAKNLEEEQKSLNEQVEQKFPTLFDDTSLDTTANLADIEKMLTTASQDPELGEYITPERIEEALSNIIICSTPEEYLEKTNQQISYFNPEDLKNIQSNQKIIIPPNSSIKDVVYNILKSSYFTDKTVSKPSIFNYNLNENNIAKYSNDLINNFLNITDLSSLSPEKLLKNYFAGSKNELYYFIENLVKKNGGGESFRRAIEKTLVETAVRKNLISRQFLQNINRSSSQDLTSNLNSSVSISSQNNIDSKINTPNQFQTSSNEELKGKIQNKKAQDFEQSLHTHLSLNNPDLNSPNADNIAIDINPSFETKYANKGSSTALNSEISPNYPESRESAGHQKGVQSSKTEGFLNQTTPGTSKQYRLEHQNKAQMQVNNLGFVGTNRFRKNHFLGSNGNLENNNLEDEDSLNDLSQETSSLTGDDPSLSSLESNNPKTVDSGSQPLKTNKNFASNNLENSQTLAKKASNKLLKNLITKHPMVLIIGIIALVLLFIIFFILMSGGTNSSYSSNLIGLGGYEHVDLGDSMCNEVYVYDTVKDQDGVYSLEEYIEGVVNAEVGGFQDLETYKVFAIAARSYAFVWMKTNNKTCEISGYSGESQSFVKNENNELIKQAVNETRGLVLTENDNLVLTQYDAFYWDHKDNENYYLVQKNYATSKNQQIPISWVDDNVPQTYLEKPLSHGHGNGLSQYGTYNLVTQVGYKFDKVISYYFGENVKLKSIYASTITGEYPLDPNDALYQKYKYLKNKSLTDVLAENNTTLEDYNTYLANVVNNAGPKTRNAAVSLGLSLIGSLAEMGYRLNYDWGGKYYSLGANPNWGQIRTNYYTNCTSIGDRADINYCRINYRYTSFDCSGFVNWILINTFGTEDYYNKNIHSYTTNSSGIHKTLNSSKPVCQPGDLLSSSGHVVMIAGFDDANKRYIVLESRGGATNGGVTLGYYSYGAKDYWCLDLSTIYGE